MLSANTKLLDQMSSPLIWQTPPISPLICAMSSLAAVLESHQLPSSQTFLPYCNIISFPRNPPSFTFHLIPNHP